MKKYFVLFLFFCCIFTQSFADWITISSPVNNHTYSIPPGQSSMSIAVSWTYDTDSSNVWFSIITDAGTLENVTSPTTINGVSAGSKNWTLKMNYSKGGYATVAMSFTVAITPYIIADNNFTDDTGTGTHGEIGVSGYSGNQTTPFSFPKAIGSSVTLTAVSDQTDNEGYQRVWHEGSHKPSRWFKNGVPQVTTTINHTFIVTEEDNNATYTAELRKICNVSFQNSFAGTSGSGVIKVSGVNYSSPTYPFPVVEENPISVEAVYNYDFGGDVQYRFDRWSNGGTNTGATIYPTEHGTYTAIYKTLPIFTEGRYRNLVITGSVRPGVGYLKLKWDEHPNTGVTQYQIWRKIKYVNGIPQSYTPVKIATVNRGTTSFIDYDYQYAPTNKQTELEYDVRAYYAPEQTTSLEDWEHVSAYGLYDVEKEVFEKNETITDYSISNYPNPFNPTTKIEYQLPKAGLVTVKVYNSLGKEIATLVNDQKSEGKYTVDFDAGNLASGIYFCEMRANDYTSIKKMLLVK